MTFPAHGTMTAAISYVWLHDPVIILFFATLGIMNDLLRIIFNEPNWQGTYQILHRPDKYFNRFGRNPKYAYYIYVLWIIVWPIGLHSIIDWYWHKENGGWKWWGWPVEVLYWVGLYYTGLPTQFLNYLMEFI